MLQFVLGESVFLLDYLEDFPFWQCQVVLHVYFCIVYKSGVKFPVDMFQYKLMSTVYTNEIHRMFKYGCQTVLTGNNLHYKTSYQNAKKIHLNNVKDYIWKNIITS